VDEAKVSEVLGGGGGSSSPVKEELDVCIAGCGHVGALLEGEPEAEVRT
jgi:hypothetical protein